MPAIVWAYMNGIRYLFQKMPAWKQGMKIFQHKCNFIAWMDKYSNHFYNKNLQPYANRLRKEMTKAEACLMEICSAGK